MTELPSSVQVVHGPNCIWNHQSCIRISSRMTLDFVVDLIDIFHFILDWMNVELSRIFNGGQLEEETRVFILLDIIMKSST